jgi:hypothetical protein
MVSRKEGKGHGEEEKTKAMMRERPLATRRRKKKKGKREESKRQARGEAKEGAANAISPPRHRDEPGHRDLLRSAASRQ